MRYSGTKPFPFSPLNCPHDGFSILVPERLRFGVRQSSAAFLHSTFSRTHSPLIVCRCEQSDDDSPSLGEHLSRLGGGERNSFRPDGTKVAQQPSERALAPFHVAAFSLARHLSPITRHFRMRYSGTKRFLVFKLKSPHGGPMPTASRSAG